MPEKDQQEVVLTHSEEGDRRWGPPLPLPPPPLSFSQPSAPSPAHSILPSSPASLPFSSLLFPSLSSLLPHPSLWYLCLFSSLSLCPLSLPLPHCRQGVLSTPPPAVHTPEKQHNLVPRTEGGGLSTSCRSASPRLSLQLQQDPGHASLRGGRDCLLPSGSPELVEWRP